MQIVFGFGVLAVIGVIVWLKHLGVTQVARNVARWLLAYARARDARDAEFAAERVALAEVR